MNETRLSIGQLLEGGLAQLLAFRSKAIAGILAFFIIELILAFDYRGDIPLPPVLSQAMSEDAIWFMIAVLAIYYVAYAVLSAILTRSLIPTSIDRHVVGSSNASLIGMASIAYYLSVIGISFGLVFLVLPGIYLIARWYLIVPLVVSGRSGIIDAFTQSWDATHASAGALMGISLVIVIPALILGGVDYMSDDPEATYTVPRLVLDSAVFALSTVFGIAVSVFAYRKLIDDREEYRTVFD
ncbi:hypothetical protein [Pontixanthobacter sp. CEM42]|uniref:hypothetical protein n=1 Tax=Pontixanthobacter sp. CEM42 TaxID=2792077 RepID=UPI001AE0091F|nr:hypothetical protein [Pontixanthobacter sp. CEM42]